LRLSFCVFIITLQQTHLPHELTNTSNEDFDELQDSSPTLQWEKFQAVVFKAKSLLPKTRIQIRQRRRGLSWSDPVPSAGSLTMNEALALLDDDREEVDALALPFPDLPYRYCPSCLLPVYDDPKPEDLSIFLHALRYTTSLGTFETGMPEWATEGFVWSA
jgi:hypothetical protein